MTKAKKATWGKMTQAKRENWDRGAFHPQYKADLRRIMDEYDAEIEMVMAEYQRSAPLTVRNAPYAINPAGIFGEPSQINIHQTVNNNTTVNNFHFHGMNPVQEAVNQTLPPDEETIAATQNR